MPPPSDETLPSIFRIAADAWFTPATSPDEFAVKTAETLPIAAIAYSSVSVPAGLPASPRAPRP